MSSPATPGTVALRPVRPDDLEPMFEFQSDPESNRLAAAGTVDQVRAACEAQWRSLIPGLRLINPG